MTLAKLGSNRSHERGGRHLVEEVKADLLVVGNVGLGTMRGRLLGSVPANVSGRAKTDVLIVHTAG